MYRFACAWMQRITCAPCSCCGTKVYKASSVRAATFSPIFTRCPTDLSFVVSPLTPIIQYGIQQGTHFVVFSPMAIIMLLLCMASCTHSLRHCPWYSMCSCTLLRKALVHCGSLVQGEGTTLQHAYMILFALEVHEYRKDLLYVLEFHSLLTFVIHLLIIKANNSLHDPSIIIIIIMQFKLQQKNGG